MSSGGKRCRCTTFSARIRSKDKWSGTKAARERRQSIECRSSRLPASQAYRRLPVKLRLKSKAQAASDVEYTYHSVCNCSRRCQFPPTSHWSLAGHQTAARSMLSGGSRSLKLVVEERMIPLHFPRPGSPPIVSVLVLARDTPPNLRPSPWSAPDW